MHDLIKSSINAHGGLDRWGKVSQVSFTTTPFGLALKLRGQATFSAQPTRATFDTHQQRATFEPFLAEDRTGVFEPYRTSILTADGAVVEALDNPRHSYKPDTPWTGPELLHFAGYAMWTYHNLPFAFTWDGTQFEDAQSWTEDGETWRAVKVTFPPSFVTHSTDQTFYFDDKGLMRRHDYSVDIAGGCKAAQYLRDLQDVDGIIFPTKRRIHPRAPDNVPNKSVTLMAADLTEFELRAARLDPHGQQT